MYLTMKKLNLSILICNALEHFDTALYVFLAPILAKLFFPTDNYIMQLIWAYSGIALSGFTRPFGSYVFSKIVQKLGPISCLKISIFGVSIVTILIGLIPSYKSIGWLSTICLMSCRLTLGFFAAGEITISRTFLMDKDNSYKISALYESSTMFGIILTSAVSALIFYNETYELWRLVFILSGLIGFFAYYLRSDIGIITHMRSEKVSFQKFKVFQIFVNRIMYNITYYVPFVLMNTIIPMINQNVSVIEMMSYNTMLLIFDLLVFIVISRSSLKISPKKVIFYSYVLLAISMPLLFTLLHNSTILTVTAIRIVIVILGVISVTAQNLYFNQMFKSPSDKYQIVGNSVAISDSICKAIPVILLWIFNVTGSIYFLGICIAFVSILCIYCNNFD